MVAASLRPLLRATDPADHRRVLPRLSGRAERTLDGLDVLVPRPAHRGYRGDESGLIEEDVRHRVCRPRPRPGARERHEPIGDRERESWTITGPWVLLRESTRASLHGNVGYFIASR